jgi:hypothetical protein
MVNVGATQFRGGSSVALAGRSVSAMLTSDGADVGSERRSSHCTDSGESLLAKSCSSCLVRSPNAAERSYSAQAALGVWHRAVSNQGDRGDRVVRCRCLAQM